MARTEHLPIDKASDALSLVLEQLRSCVGWGEGRTPTETPIFTEMLGFAKLTPTYGRRAEREAVPPWCGARWRIALRASALQSALALNLMAVTLLVSS